MEELIQWTHYWSCVAENIYSEIQNQDETNILEAITQRNLKIPLFIIASYNVHRGSERILGAKNPLLNEFNNKHSYLKNIRDSLEHFDEYAIGRGRRQKSEESSYDRPPFILESTTGSSIGHIFKYIIQEKSGCKEYIIKCNDLIDSVKIITKASMQTIEKFDEHLHRNCPACNPPT